MDESLFTSRRALAQRLGCPDAPLVIYVRRAWALEGGIEGGEPGVDDQAFIDRVRAEPLPLARQRRDLGVGSDSPSHWITRERPRIDRIACPWLVRLHDGDDHALLAAGMPVYDALYAWCVAELEHRNESHHWRPA